MGIRKIREALAEDPQGCADELLEEVREQYGEVPYILQYMRSMPEVLVPKILYTDAITREFKNLDARTVELISIAVSSALRCDHCMKMHIRVARRMGIPDEEILDAMLIAGSLSNAAVLAEGTRAMANASGDVGAGECGGGDVCD